MSGTAALLFPEPLIRTNNGTPESVVRRSYDDSSLPWKDRWTPLYDEVVYGHYRRVVAFAHEQKLIRKPIPVEELLEPRFVHAGLKNLGLGNYWGRQQLAARQESFSPRRNAGARSLCPGADAHHSQTWNSTIPLPLPKRCMVYFSISIR